MLDLDGERFTTACSRYLDSDPHRPEPSAKVYVKLSLPPRNRPLLAQLDTGAAWSVFDPMVCSELGILDGSGLPCRVHTRLGPLGGRLERATFTIVADRGVSLKVEATVFACKEWPDGWNFLGYSGMLDQIRFALDPGTNLFYFGRTAP